MKKHEQVIDLLGKIENELKGMRHFFFTNAQFNKDDFDSTIYPHIALEGKYGYTYYYIVERIWDGKLRLYGDGDNEGERVVIIFDECTNDCLLEMARILNI